MAEQLWQVDEILNTAAHLWWGARVREQLAVALREEASKDIHSIHRAGPRKVKRMEAGGPQGSSRRVPSHLLAQTLPNSRSMPPLPLTVSREGVSAQHTLRRTDVSPGPVHSLSLSLPYGRPGVVTLLV